MNIRITFISIVLLGLALSGVGAQEAKPGPQHALLKKFEGDWKVECRLTLPQVEEPIVYEGTYGAKVELGGFFLVGEFKTNFGGNPTTGRGTTGYDPTKKEYVGVWVESNKPVMTQLRGKWDEKKEVYSETMTMPVEGGKTLTMKSITKFRGKDVMLTTVTWKDPGEEKESTLEMMFRRKE